MFHLRFPLDDVRSWADSYEFDDDNNVPEAGRQAQRRGYYTQAKVLEICRWKARGRIQQHAKKNSEELIRRVTGIALSTNNEFERLRIMVLLCLEGVGWPVASVMLHLGHGDRYPILDFRALWSLGVNKKPQWYTFDQWWDYVEHCRKLRDEAGVSMRVLDRALWQYSRDNQRPFEENL